MTASKEESSKGSASADASTNSRDIPLLSAGGSRRKMMHAMCAKRSAAVAAAVVVVEVEVKIVKL